MQTVEVAIKPVVKITLKPDTEVLDEVVVTGYGNFKKSSFTGAASSITTEKLQDVPSLSVQDKLAGSVAGVQITSTSGQPGAVESVRIRGMGSINAGNDPLYVIDGVPVMTGDASEFTYSQSGNSLLSTINSNDIESMTVIKDAAAASLYGSRAANGVIVITTKKGASGKLKLNVRADWGFSNKAIDYRPILNGEDRRDILYMGLKNYATNIGIDLTLFNRLTVSAEWYNRETKDLLMDKPISAAVGVINSSGVANMLVNVGSMRNRGFELELKSTNIQNKDLLWTTSLNIGHNKNKLTKLDGEQQEIISGVSIHRVGQPYYSIYAYEYAGVDPQTGKELYYINGEDGSRETTTNSAAANKTIIGSIEPKVQGGLTNYVSWKFIDFNLTLTYSLGGHAYDYATWLQSNGGTYHYLGNVPAYYKMEDTWQKTGDNAKLPQFAYGNANKASSRWLMSTDHLRVKNMTLGFTLPQSWSSKAGISKLRAYVSGNNLLTWKKKSLYVDPEVPVDGLCTFETPALRTVTFGLEIGF